jgi:hypothetical protein
MADKAEAIYVYIEIGPDGEEGIAGIVAPGMGNMPMITSRERVLPGLDRLAQSHARASGRRVELRRYTAVEVIRGFEPKGG